MGIHTIRNGFGELVNGRHSEHANQYSWMRRGEKGEKMVDEISGV